MSIYQHYVYAYLREDGSPYYIGKGKNDRAYKKHCVPVPKNHSRIVFLETNLSDVGACALERRYIRWYGRKDLGTGILRNLTDGGEGSSGLSISEETRRKMSESKRGRKFSEEHRHKMSEAKRGRKFSEEHRHKMSLSKRNMTLETRAKISEKTKRRWIEWRAKKDSLEVLDVS